MALRKIIEIDEEKCTGCGQCILDCAEGAIKIVNGKAKLVGEIYCDGLGACIGGCPEGALTIVERDAEQFDEKAVEALLAGGQDALHAVEPGPTGFQCPGAAMKALKPEPATRRTPRPSTEITRLGHWPVKLQLLGPQAPFLQGADLVLLADCVAVAHPNLHRDVLDGAVVATGCPKLDVLQAHIERLASILAQARPASLTVYHMEVPCCSGFVHAARKAAEISSARIPLKRVKISRTGTVLETEDMSL